ncbi:MAG: excinuclease ABC subunit UvrA [Patescibacteria group bacterium]|nr:excinuclease ABC subunit UvrA [Patescibacteria group bacterium]
MKYDKISIKGARVHNLKNISLDIPKNKLTVVTGLSGSGKSSLAFDTIYAEGQRRYMESLSSYARQFLEMQDRPDVDSVDGLSPTIAIDQRSSSHNPRSTVGTVTEIYDYLRVIFARAGRAHCPRCGGEVSEQTVRDIVKKISNITDRVGIILLSPLVLDEKGEHKFVLVGASNAGYKEVRFDGIVMDIDEAIRMKKDKVRRHTIEVVVGRVGFENDISDDAMVALIKKALDLGNGMITVVQDDGEEFALSQMLYCAKCGINLPKLEPRLFSFNSPHGACPACTGLGIKLILDEDLVIPNKRLTIAQGAVKPWTRIAGNQTWHIKLLEKVGERHGFSVNQPVGDISADKIKKILHGTGDEQYELECKSVTFPGILNQLEQKYKETDSDYVRREIETYMQTQICPVCRGKRLRPEVLAVTFGEKSIDEVVNIPIVRVNEFFDQIGSRKGKTKNLKPAASLSDAEQKIADQAMREIRARLKNLLEVGLGYLTLDRSIMSLAGGESQRVRLSTQLGTGLSGVIYILDEPTVGLHPRDNEKLIRTLMKLRDMGNTVIVVEHDQAMMEAADHVIDIGPGAGEYGGELIAQGTTAEIKKKKSSLTGDYLAGRKKIEIPKKYRAGNRQAITVRGATAFNLKNIDVKFPLGEFVCVTGVSGSGKSTLVLDILGAALAKKFYRAKTVPGEHKDIKGVENIDKVVTVDQSPIGRTPRSNPATYTGVFTVIRDLFAETPEAKMRGFDAGKFSFNVKGGGRCEHCSGEGYVCIEMQFMPDVYIECPECRSRRYNTEALEIHLREKNIADILDMTVEEARRFFSQEQLIYEKLNILQEVGLGYIKLGQPATTLSGGEAQRVKLATELARRATGRTLYILDEPTTGLHFEDIKRLLGVLNQLVDKGNTVLVIEHNLEVIKCADWVIDLGPDGGDEGGELVAQGTPRDIVKVKRSVTGQYLKKII